MDAYNRCTVLPKLLPSYSYIILCSPLQISMNADVGFTAVLKMPCVSTHVAASGVNVTLDSLEMDSRVEQSKVKSPWSVVLDTNHGANNAWVSQTKGVSTSQFFIII